MNTVFSDAVTVNNPIRKHNVEILAQEGFTQSGAYSCSGRLHLVELKTKVKLVFGLRSNIAGKKFFSLSKDFTDAKTAKEYFRRLEPKLQKAEIMPVRTGRTGSVVKPNKGFMYSFHARYSSKEAAKQAAIKLVREGSTRHAYVYTGVSRNVPFYDVRTQNK